jgi:lipoic acid synthetase
MIDEKSVSLQRHIRTRMPPWLRRPIACKGKKQTIENQLTSTGLHTVCVEAQCPNQGECFGRGTATFLILGNTCTRKCVFCGVTQGVPEPVAADEPQRVCDAVATMGLKHVVITSVTRDDLDDGGAIHFARTISLLKDKNPEITVEVLTPDFKGNVNALETVLNAKPDVFNHNIETVSRLYGAIRPQAIYARSLQVLAKAAEYGIQLGIKSGLMVGLGETYAEVAQTLADLRGAGCTLVTIGQYLQPSDRQVPVERFITPEEFKEYENIGLKLGFSRVFAGSFVRSSYRAEEILCDGALKKIA